MFSKLANTGDSKQIIYIATQSMVRADRASRWGRSVEGNIDLSEAFTAKILGRGISQRKHVVSVLEPVRWFFILRKDRMEAYIE